MYWTHFDAIRIDGSGAANLLSAIRPMTQFSLQIWGVDHDGMHNFHNICDKSLRAGVRHRAVNTSALLHPSVQNKNSR
jgi:hypothetical protein